MTATALAPLAPETLDACLEAATAAPSIHNTQPWLFRAHGPEIEVLADPHRRLEALDPDGRQLAISVGAAALTLRVAVRARGRLPVQRVLPDSTRPELMVSVLTGPFVPPGGNVLALARAVARRHTSRVPFRSAAIPWRVQQDLVGAATVEGASLTFCDPITRDGILALTRTADEALRRGADYRAELAEWTHRTADRHDGIPAGALGPRDSRDRLPLRDFRTGQTARRTAAFERYPAIAVLSTAGDTCFDWVRAGQALQRVLLTATVHDLVATPMNQALEVPALRRLVTDGGRRAQAVLRFGYGHPGAATPRRDLREVRLP